ncbi:MAG: DUF4332 domain-containing protein [Candidatus Bathyarchaeota archaeon]|jgi:hypothetical protein
MDEEAFTSFLKRGGRSTSAIKRCLHHVRAYQEYLKGQRGGTGLVEAGPQDLEAYVEWVETDPKASAKIPLWALRYLFQFIDNEEMEVLARNLREARIKRRPFPLKGFVGVDPDIVKRLKSVGVGDVKSILEAGGTLEGRERLSVEAGVPLDVVLELVKLSDLARIPGVKGIRARLYHDAGVDTVQKMADWDPEELREMLVGFVERTEFEGVPPQPSEARFTVETAKKLKDIVEW